MKQILILFSLLLTLTSSYGFATGVACNAVYELTANTLPASKYTHEIRDTNGKKILWLTPPGGAAYALGEVSTIKAGTPIFHWGGDVDINSLLKTKQLDQAHLETNILNSNQGSDVVGGGFYVSADPLDSANYGARGVAMTTAKDIQSVMTNSFQKSEKLDIILAIREAGISIIQENARPTWFNIVQADVPCVLKELDFKTALPFIAVKDPTTAFMDLVIIDQKHPIDLNEWPENLVPALRKLASGIELTNDEKKTVLAPMGDQKSMIRLSYLFMANDMVFAETPLFKALDALYTATYGKNLTDTLSR